ncbi:MAG: hypothetical protein IT294_19355 [Deltaproteobacteria bacterium]|nr:hypothetical protein [Deltaproteobacteria bacterium]
MTGEDAPAWKRCNTCKKPIAFGGGYFSCSVSTCSRKGTDFAFCSVACWDAHVPVLRHRDAWAEEATAPTAAEWAAHRRAEAERTAAGSRASASATRSTAPPSAAATPVPIPRDVLIVVSKLKAYVRARAGMHTSDGVLDVLSERVRALCDRAIDQARAHGRKTVLDRDFD